MAITYGNHVIYKYPISLAGSHKVIKVKMPFGAQLLGVQVQNERIVVWAAVNEDVEIVTRRFWVLGTGWRIPEGIALRHLKTLTDDDGYVWHVFEEAS